MISEPDYVCYDREGLQVSFERGPTGILLMAGGDYEWGCATLEPTQARALAAALIKAADEIEGVKS